MSKVALVGVTKPNMGTTDCTTADELVAYTARVSNPANQNNTESAPRLIRYLIRNQHWSPFEMISVTMEIKTTRDISRQILRHRSFSFQEFSQRYAVSEDFVYREARLQDPNNRQNSISIADEDFGKGGNKTQEERLYEEWNMRQARVVSEAKKVYQWALDHGIAKEQARVVLPEGNTETTLYMAGTLRSWIHYCDLRMAHGTQKEHMIVASKCWDMLKIHFPDVCEAVEGMNDE
jgi:thymidylate synthase (FAD)